MLRENELKTRAGLWDKHSRQLLLWSVIWSVLNYLVFATVIVRLYQSNFGKHPGWLIGWQAGIIIFMGLLKISMWKHSHVKRAHFNIIANAAIVTTIRNITALRKLIVIYLVEVTLLLAVSCFFFLTIRHGPYLLLKFTALVAMLNYILGFYLIINFGMQIRKYSKMKTQVVDSYRERISQN